MSAFPNLLRAAACALLLLPGCTKDEDTTPAPVVAGSISGYVSAYDENGAIQAREGTVVSVDNSAPQLTATTDAAGKFELANVPAGTYNLTFTRPGFSTFRRSSVAHLGGPEPTFLPNITMSQVSGTTVTALAAMGPLANGNFAVEAAVANPTPGSTFRVAVFVGAAAGVTADTGMLLGVFNLSTTSPSLALSKRDLNGAGIASGARVYAVAYGAPVNNPAYVDPATGRTVYPSLNATASPVIEFVAP